MASEEAAIDLTIEVTQRREYRRTVSTADIRSTLARYGRPTVVRGEGEAFGVYLSRLLTALAECEVAVNGFGEGARLADEEVKTTLVDWSWDPVEA